MEKQGMDVSERYVDRARRVTEQVDRVVLGKEKEVKEIMLAFLANGHVLLEDIPGVGKTTLARAFSKAMRLDCRRVQFTPDVLPSDLTGFSIYHKEKEQFVYQPGSVFCNLLLADELNRTSPKTQSALLEVMEERRVSVEGVTRAVPNPFLVIATQNPQGSVGTQSLPDSQTDRFAVSLSLGYPNFENELSMAMTVGELGRTETIIPVMDGTDLSVMQHDVHQVYIKKNLCRYIVKLITATRDHRYLKQGASPRATIALVKMAKSAAWYAGRRFVIPSDIEEQFLYTVRHRLVLNAAARAESITAEQILQEILSDVPKPSLGEIRR